MPGSGNSSQRLYHNLGSTRAGGGLGALAAGALMLLFAIGAHADARKCDTFVRSELARHRTTGWSRVIVRVPGALTAAQQARLRSLGVRVVRHYSIIRGFACVVPSRNLSALVQEPFIERVSSDVRVQKTDDYTVPATGADIAYQQYRLDGTGVAVAVIDSGVKTGTSLHADLKGSKGVSRVIVSRNFVAGQTTADDQCGHGTLVAGIIAGNGAASTGSAFTRTFPGIARNVSVVSLRALDVNGMGSVSDVIAAVQWAVNNRAAYKIRVINLSLGHPAGESYVTDPLCQAVEAAWRAGIVVVCSAGNAGRMQTAQSAGADNEGWGTSYGSIQSPGSDPSVITVGAVKNVDGVRAHDRIATYSSRGPTRLDFVLKPDLVAPGNRIIATRGYASWVDNRYSSSNIVPLREYSTRTTGTPAYFRISGTSMAAPVVAGAAALMLQSNPNLSPDTVKLRLMVSADKWGFPDGTADPCTFGAGYLNIPAALQSTLVAVQPVVSPTLYLDGSGGVCIDRAIWGSMGIWNAQVPDFKAIWGDRAIWGSNMLSSSATVGASPTPWESKAIWGDGTTQVDLSGKALTGE